MSWFITRMRIPSLQLLLRIAAAAAVVAVGLFAIVATTSKSPLGERDQGFVDPSIMGRWGEPPWEQDGEVAEVGFEATFDAAGELRLVSDPELDEQEVYTGHTTLLDGRRYLNLKLIDCLGCAEDERSRIKANPCPYTIWQYATQLNPAVISSLNGHDADALSKFDGRFLLLVYMDLDVIDNAIESGLLDGDMDCDACIDSDTCMTAEPTELQTFVRQNQEALFPPDNWLVYTLVP